MTTSLFLLLACVVVCAITGTAMDQYSCTKSSALVPKRESMQLLRSLLLPLTDHKFLADIVQRQSAVLTKTQMGASYLNNLIGYEDIDLILLHGRKSSDPNASILHGEDWKVAKRVFVDGKWHTGVIPMKENMTLTVAKEAFTHGGFSIIIDSMESLSPRVHMAARLLEDALGWRVRVNMYLSPPGAQGFEAHFDWMDGLVLQLRGAKHWSLYAPLMAMFPRPDQMMTPDAVGFLSAGDTTAEFFTLRAGDVAYVPRGVVHEANTRGQSQNVTDININSDTDMDAAAKDRRQEGAEPSLHLTFGLETATHHSTEMFLHHLIAVHGTLLQPTTFTSDDGRFTFHCGTKYDRKAYDRETGELGGSVEDCVHVLLAAIASHDSNAGALLRRAVATTVMGVGVPGLDPEELVPAAIRTVTSLPLADLGQIIEFMLDRNLLRLSPLTSIGVGSEDEEPDVWICIVPPQMSDGNRDRGGDNHLSADRSCRYLNRFMSQEFFDNNRTIAVSMSIPDCVDMSGNNEVSCICSYLHQTSWRAAVVPLKALLSTALLGTEDKQAAFFHDRSGLEEAYCAAWARMTADINVDRRERRRMDVTALRAAGYTLPRD